MIFFSQLIISGIALGMIYALVAIGFVLILKCSNAFNIAQGQFVLIGGYLAYTFLVMFNLPIWVSLLLAIIIGAVIGLLIERFTIRPLLGKPVIAIVMMTIALAAVLEGFAMLIWGGEYKTYHGFLPAISLKLGDLSISSESLIGIIISAITVVILLLIFRYTKIGLAIKATAEDLQVVQVFGVRVTTVYAIAWVIAAVTGILAGVLMGGISGVSIPIVDVGLKALVIALLGGVNSIGGTIVAGIMLGILENIAAGYLDPILTGGGVASIFPFIVMMIVLIFRPSGLFGEASIKRI